MEIIETGIEVKPFIRRYYWYRGKTNYRPRVEFLKHNKKWKGIKFPLVNFAFKPIDAKEFVSVQPMTLGG